jgi:CIC family chloride channel protein
MTETTQIPEVSETPVEPHNIRRFLRRDSVSYSVLILAVIIGAIVGLVGTFFQIAVHWVSSQRSEWLLHAITDKAPLWLSAFFISALLALVGYYLVFKFAPEAGGSGIPEIEGAMEELRPVRWWRVVPVKFIGGIGSLGSGMVLGREGPTVQMGGNLGRMVCDIFKLKDKDGRHALLAAGSAAGLTAAFNAPLASILFVVEEMRPQFRYNLISIKAVVIACIMSDVVYRLLRDSHAIIHMPQYQDPGIGSLWLFLVLGILFGIFGVAFNKLILLTQDWLVGLHKNSLKRYLFMGAMIGGFFGVLLLYFPNLTGGGEELIPHAIGGHFTMDILIGLFVFRVVTTLICFCSGAPGGIFAPMLALGTLFGMFYGNAAQHFFPELISHPGVFAVAGMGALFAATVRAPITGVVLVIEMTGNYHMILPLLITTLGATLLAQVMGGQPIYSQLLHRTLKKEKLGQDSHTEMANS